MKVLFFWMYKKTLYKTFHKTFTFLSIYLKCIPDLPAGQ